MSTELYSSIAKEDGKVIEVTPEGMKVEYTNGETDTFSLGYGVGNATGENRKHLKVTGFKVGCSFTKGTILAFDESFFVRAGPDPTRVNIKLGTMVIKLIH